MFDLALQMTVGGAKSRDSRVAPQRRAPVVHRARLWSL
jgi:hypothetical protein